MGEIVTEVITVTGAGSRTIPPNAKNVKVEAWGPGGHGGADVGQQRTSGGGGGAYIAAELAMSPGDVLYYVIGAGGGVDTWFRSNTNSKTGAWIAGAGGSAGGTTVGNGGTPVNGSSGILISSYSGGNGRPGSSGTLGPSGGGGGGAGPNGAGGIGATASTSRSGAGGTGNGGLTPGGPAITAASTSGAAGTSHVDGGGGGSGATSPGSGVPRTGGAGGVPGGAGGGTSGYSSAVAQGGRGQLRITYEIIPPASFIVMF